MLTVIAEADSDESYKPDGASTTVDWVVDTLAVNSTAARRMIRVARRLAEFPCLEPLVADGSLSVDQTAALMEFIEPDEDPDIVAGYARLSTPELRRIARSNRRIEPKPVHEQRLNR